MEQALRGGRNEFKPTQSRKSTATCEQCAVSRSPSYFFGEMLALLPVREGGVQVGLKPWAQITIKARLETNQDSNPQSVLLDLSPNIKSESELFNKRNVRNNEELNGCAIPSDIVYRYTYI